MAKLKLEKVTGVVALSYLILIPVGAYYAWRKIQINDQDVNAMWEKLNMEPPQHAPIIDLTAISKRFQGR